MAATAARRVNRVPLRARRRIWSWGLLIVFAIGVFGALGVQPLMSGRREDQRTRSAVLVLQQISDLRTDLSAWQVYIQPLFADFSAKPAKVEATELARGALLAQAQATQARVVVRSLRAAGLSANANAIDNANRKYAKSIAAFGKLDGGASASLIAATIRAETATFSGMLVSTTSSGTQLRARTASSLQAAVGRLDSGRRMFLIADGIAGALVIAGAFVIGQGARRRERAEGSRAERQDFESTLQDALEMAKNEPEVFATMTQAFRESVPRLQVEMLVADSSRAHFHQTVQTGVVGQSDERTGCGVVSPFDCPATRRGHTLVFTSSRALHACPYLKDRRSGDLSAACTPISITGQTSGVVHATAPEGAPPTALDIEYVEITSRRASERIAMLRAFEKSEAQARTDPLTGLWNRRSLENRINDLQREGTPYALAYADLDNFKALNDTHGHESGDQALRLFSRVLRDSVRPTDITARYGGEEFIIVLPDCLVETATKILERLRERLALTLTGGRVPLFTVSFGLASSVDADTFDEVVAVADRALLTAKATGRNRTVLASGPTAMPAPEAHDEARPALTA